MPDLLTLVPLALNDYDLTEVETALVQLYTRRHELVPVTGGAVAAALTAPANPEVVELLAAADEWSLDSLVTAFELLVPADEAQLFGAVFTPEAITTFMARELCDRASQSGRDLTVLEVADPAVGCGALLLAVLREVVNRTGADAAAVASRFHGFDVSSHSLHRAQILLEIACLELGSQSLPQPRLVLGDALMLEENVDGFADLLIANPPYVRFQHLPLERREQLSERFATCGPGNFNLYFPFFEISHRMLKPGGLSALITPNGFFTSMSGKPVRRWMCETAFLDDVFDFGTHRVFRAMTYTAVLFGTRRTAPLEEYAGFGYVTGAGLADLPEAGESWTDAPQHPDPTGSGNWRLVAPAVRAAITTIAEAGTKLSDVADIRFGLATCRDKLYMLDGTRTATGNFVKTYNGVQYEVEPGLTRRCIKVSGTQSVEELDDAQTRILYPYSLTDGSAVILGEDQLAREFPHAYTYLRAIREELERRDNGRKTYAAWYAYARTQGLVPGAPRLLTPLYAGTPRFLLDTHEDGLFINGCSVTVKDTAPDGVDLEALGWLLNSAVCRFFIETTSVAISNGFFAYQKKQLGALGVLALTEEDRAVLRSATAAGRDKKLAELYGVTLPAEYLSPEDSAPASDDAKPSTALVTAAV